MRWVRVQEARHDRQHDADREREPRELAQALRGLRPGEGHQRRPGVELPELLARAMHHIRQGYQRIVGYEVEGGGFSLYGKEPANPALTALGIHLLLDIGEVMEVDRRVIEDAAKFIDGCSPVDDAAAIYARGAVARARGGKPQARDREILDRGAERPGGRACAAW